MNGFGNLKFRVIEDILLEQLIMKRTYPNRDTFMVVLYFFDFDRAIAPRLISFSMFALS